MKVRSRTCFVLRDDPSQEPPEFEPRRSEKPVAPRVIRSKPMLPQAPTQEPEAEAATDAAARADALGSGGPIPRQPAVSDARTRSNPAGEEPAPAAVLRPGPKTPDPLSAPDPAADIQRRA